MLRVFFLNYWKCRGWVAKENKIFTCLWQTRLFALWVRQDLRKSLCVWLYPRAQPVRVAKAMGTTHWFWFIVLCHANVYSIQNYVRAQTRLRQICLGYFSKCLSLRKCFHLLFLQEIIAFYINLTDYCPGIYVHLKIVILSIHREREKIWFDDHI